MDKPTDSFLSHTQSRPGPSRRQLIKTAAAGAGLAMLGGRARAADAPLRKVRMAHGVPVIDISTAPWDSAGLTGGFWREEGLDVEVMGFNGAGPAYQALINGEIDLAISGSPDVLMLREQGMPIKVIASVYDHNHAFSAVFESSPIKRVEDFKGKKVGIHMLTGSPPLWLKAELQEHGLTVDDLGGLIPVGNGAAALHALQTGQIDVLDLYHGQYSLFEAELGLKFRKFDDDPAVAENSFVQVVTVSDKLIRDDPKMLTGMLRGIAKGIIFSHENPVAAARGHYKYFPRSRAPGTPLEEAVAKASRVIELSGTISTTSALAGHWGYASPDQIEHVRDLLFNGGIIKKKLPWQEYYTPEFIAEANHFDIEAVRSQARAAG